MTLTIKTDVDLMKTIADRFNTSIESLKSTAGLVYSLSYQPLTTALLANSAARGLKSFRLYPNDGPLMLILLAGSWTNAKDDKKIINAQRANTYGIDELAKSRALAMPYKLLIYTFPGQDVIGSIGAVSKGDLQAVNKKYGPPGFLQKTVPGGLKLFPYVSKDRLTDVDVAFAFVMAKPEL